MGRAGTRQPSQLAQDGDLNCSHQVGLPVPALCSLQAYTAAVPPPGPGRLLKAGATVLIAGALLLLAGAIGAFYFWKATERQVSTASLVQAVSNTGHGLETCMTGLIKRSLSRSFFFFSILKKQTYNNYLYWLRGWRLLEAHFLLNVQHISRSTDATLISAHAFSANSKPSPSLGIHIPGKLQPSGQNQH